MVRVVSGPEAGDGGSPGVVVTSTGDCLEEIKPLRSSVGAQVYETSTKTLWEYREGGWVALRDVQP